MTAVQVPAVLTEDEYTKVLLANAATLVRVGPDVASWPAEARRCARVPYSVALDIAAAMTPVLGLTGPNAVLRLAPESATALASVWGRQGPRMTHPPVRGEWSYATWGAVDGLEVAYGRLRSPAGRTLWEDHVISWSTPEPMDEFARGMAGLLVLMSAPPTVHVRHYVLPGLHAAGPAAGLLYAQLRGRGIDQAQAARTVADTLDVHAQVEDGLVAWTPTRRRVVLAPGTRPALGCMTRGTAR